MAPAALRDVLMQRAFDAYYAGNLVEARAASESLLSIADLNSEWQAALLRNSVFYAARMRELAPDLTRLQAQPSRAALAARDPSPAVVGGRVMALFDEGHVPGASRPASAIPGAILDASGVTLSRFEAPVLGGNEVARCRLAPLGTGGVALCAWAPGEQSAVVMRIEPDTMQTDTPIVVTDAAGSEGPAWMPFERNGALLLVTGVQPARVVRVLESGAVEALSESEGPPVTGRLEGGSPGAWFGDGWLFALRQFAEFEDGSRVVLHRFALLSESFAWSRLSQSFRFGDGDVRIERCAGLALAGDRLLVGVGVEDREAWLYGIPLATVRGMLRPIDDWADPEEPQPNMVLSIGGMLGRDAIPPIRLAPPPEARRDALEAWRSRASAVPPAAVAPQRPPRRRAAPREPLPVERYREAVQRLRSSEPMAAAEVCRDPVLAAGRIAESPWLAAYACWLAGDDASAVALAATAAELGWIGGRSVPSSHEMAIAWFEGPADIQRHALQRMGADSAAAESAFEAALSARKTWEAARGASAPGERQEQ